MARPPRRDDVTSATASARTAKVFVNRDKPIATLQSAALRLRDAPAGPTELLVFHGIGGQGKTMLCRHFADLLRGDAAFEDLHVGLVDLHGESRREPALASLWLRNALAKSGRIAFTAFDMAFAIYWKEAFPDLPLPTMDLPWLDRDGADLGGHAVSDLATTTVNELLQDIVTGVPFVGMTLRRLTGWAIHRGREKYIMGSNDTLKVLFRDDELLPAHQLVDLLPYVLARDLATHLKRHPKDRFVVLIDEYERVLPAGGASVLRRENPFDKAFRDAVVETDGALFVFFSRERLPWDRRDPAWAEDMARAHHPLDGLADRDAEKLLDAVPVAEADLRRAMVDGARADSAGGSPGVVYPLMLDLQIGHYRALRQAGMAPAPADFALRAEGFEGRRNEMIERLLRDYGDDALQVTLRRLAVPRWFDREVFRHLVTTFHTGFALDNFTRLAGLSFVEEMAEGRHALHSQVREGLCTLLDAESLAETHRALFAHFDARATVEDHLALTPAHLDALFEALHHRQEDDPAGLAQWWWQRTQPYRRADKYATLLPVDREVLERVEERFGPEHMETAGCVKILADSQNALGLRREGEANLRRVLSILEVLPERNRTGEAAALNNLGLCLSQQGKWPEAEPLLRRALEIAEEDLGPDDPDTAVTLNSLAISLIGQGRHEEAEPLLERSVEIDATPYSLHNLAKCRVRRAPDDAKAGDLLRQSVEVCERDYGPEHPHTATSLNGLCDWLARSGRLGEAEPLARRALAINLEARGPDHGETLRSLDRLAQNLTDQGRLDEAEGLRRRLAELVEERGGPSNLPDALYLFSLGMLLAGREKDKEAVDWLGKALPIYESGQGTRAEVAATVRRVLAAALQRLGRDDEAAAVRAGDADPPA